MRVLIAVMAWSVALTAAAAGQCTTGIPGPGGLETFDGATVGNPGVYPPGWSFGGGSLMWQVNTGITPSNNTGPTEDNTSGTGNYLYLEASNGSLDQVAIIETPCYGFGGFVDPVIDFAFHMWGGTIGTLVLERDDGISGWAPIWSRSGNQGNQWLRIQVPLTGSVARFRFIAVRGASFSGDIAIDDVRVGNRILPLFETSSDAQLDWDGVQGGAFTAARTEVPAGVQTDLNVDSTMGNNPYEIYLALGQAQPSYLITGNAQVVNVPLFDPSFTGLNGGPGTLNGFLPFSNAFSIPVTIGVPFEVVAQMIVLDGARPDGFELSQPASLKVQEDPALQPAVISGGAPDLMLGDDAVSQQSLGFGLSFFGTSYTELWVGSNGQCTFTAGDTGWAAGAMDLNDGLPMIAVCSEDFNPAQGGRVEISVTAASQMVEVWWRDIPSFFNVGSNRFKLTLLPGLARFDYDAGMFETEGTVGLSVGGGLNTLFPVNLSTAGGQNGVITVPPGSTPYEDFTNGGVQLDLKGRQISWMLDATGTPVMIQ